MITLDVRSQIFCNSVFNPLMEHLLKSVKVMLCMERRSLIMRTLSIVTKKVCFLLVFVGICMLLFACDDTDSYRTTDSNEYLQTEGHIANEGIDIRSGLFVFPESIDNLDNVEYEYSCERGTLDNSYMIYLKAEYPDTTAYQAELERLENIYCTIDTPDDTVVNKIEYTQTLFNYPAYVAIYNTNMSFEYALADDATQSVVYVFLKLYEGSDFLVDAYLPKEFQGEAEMRYDATWSGKNIYYATDGNGDHVYYLD